MPLLQVSLPTTPIDDDAELDRLHRRLCTYLEDADVGEVQTVRLDEAPEGSRSGGSVALGIFNLVISPVISGVTSALVIALIDFVKRSDRSVKVGFKGVEVTVDVKTAKQDPAMVAKLLSTVIGDEEGE